MQAHGATTAAGIRAASTGSSRWRLSWPLLVALYVYLLTLYHGNILQLLLLDGDTYWHIAAGRWILEHGVIPSVDPFSHTMPGAPWMAHEWLSEILLARARDAGGWEGVVVLTAVAFAAAAGLLMRALLVYLQPVRALMLTVVAVLMTVQHLLARPHMLALPFMMMWVIALVRARDEGRTPSLWLLPVMTLWANLHGGFTLGIALTGWFALEAAFEARGTPDLRKTLASWLLFGAGAVLAALATPHGPGTFLFTWKVLMEDQYALSRISEWASPNFHGFHPLQVWILGGLAMVLHQGLRLPPFRLLLLVGLLHLALKHVRYVELLGLLGPLIVAQSFGQQWAGKVAPARARTAPAGSSGSGGTGAILLACAIVVAAPLLLARLKPLAPPASAAPEAALQAAKSAGVAGGRVLNAYGWGGYLIYSGIPVAIDGRADVYGDAFFREFLSATELTAPGGLQQLIDKHRITWTIFPPQTPVVSLLDQLPGWKRIHSDSMAVVHARPGP